MAARGMKLTHQVVLLRVLVSPLGEPVSSLRRVRCSGKGERLTDKGIQVLTRHSRLVRHIEGCHGGI